MDEDKITRAADAFRMVVIDKRPLRDVAADLGVSHETVRRDVAAYKTYLAAQRGVETLDERRAAFIAELDDVKAMALAVYAEAKQQGKQLVAVAALNTISGLQTHYRAVGALDGAKQVKQEVDSLVKIVWDEGDEAETFHTP